MQLAFEIEGECNECKKKSVLVTSQTNIIKVKEHAISTLSCQARSESVTWSIRAK